MVFFRDCRVVAVLAQSHTDCMLIRCAQARLTLTKKSSSGNGVLKKYLKEIELIYKKAKKVGCLLRFPRNQGGSRQISVRKCRGRLRQSTENHQKVGEYHSNNKIMINNSFQVVL